MVSILLLLFVLYDQFSLLYKPKGVSGGREQIEGNIDSFFILEGARPRAAFMVTGKEYPWKHWF